MTPLLALTGVGKVFGQRAWLGRRTIVRAVDDVTLTLERGRTLGIVGESGSGKSTLLQMILRLARPSVGKIEVDGRDVWELRAAELKRLRLAVQPVFQNPASALNPRQRIGAILAAPLAVHGIGDRSGRNALVVAALESVGLPAACTLRFPHQLSGGQRQLVAIARATILKPALLLADEPTASLDTTAQAKVLGVLIDAKARLGAATILVSHDLAVVARVSDQIAVMQHGRIVEHGAAMQVLTEPRHAYTQALIAAAMAG